MTRHYLRVHENPEDGIELVHEGCPTGVTLYGPGEAPGVFYPVGSVYWSSSATAVPWAVSWHYCQEGAVAEGVDTQYRHRDDPDGWEWAEPLAPGLYPVEAWAHRTWTDCGWEYDAGLDLIDRATQ